MITLLGNRYQVVREIGAGAMGRVYQAVDTKTGGAVAAKVMIAQGDESLQALLRFYQEGALLSTLRHPNIVLVYGTFLEEGTCSIIMELLEGASLADLLARERLTLGRIRSIGSQAAAGLAFAHGRGIVHRDVKPSNIMVVGEDRVKVTDFGIARVAEGGTLRTATGMSLGTPLYMSPEQIEGGHVDARSDIYSLGAVLFEMFAGRPPFEGRDPLSVAFKHVHTPPPRPSSLNSDVPHAWESLILQMLEKDPARRVQTAEEVGARIAALTTNLDAPMTVMSPLNPIRSPGRAGSVSEPPGRPVSGSGSNGGPAFEPESGGGVATAVSAVLSEGRDGASGQRSETGGGRARLPAVAGVLALLLVAGVAFLVLHDRGGHTTPTTSALTFARQYGPFGDPEGLATDSAGNLYVAAAGDNNVVKIAPDGTEQRWGSQGAGQGQFSSPTGVALDGQGHVLVADAQNHRIDQLTTAGTWITSWGGPGSGLGQFAGVHGVAVDGAGNVYAADFGNNRIVKLSRDGSALQTWGGPHAGTGPGQFSGPVGIAVDRSGNVYVADFGNHRIQKLTAGGQFVKQFSGFGSASGLASPHGVAVDADGNIYVADYKNNVVEEITSSGTPVRVIGSPGTAHGQFEHPTAVAVDGRGQLYVADAGNRRVQVFSSAM